MINRPVAVECHEDGRSRIPEYARTSPPAYVECPSCAYDMIVTSVTPAFLRAGCQDVHYTCKKCGTQIHRMGKSR
jgi:hypothetical protein